MNDKVIATTSNLLIYTASHFFHLLRDQNEKEKELARITCVSLFTFHVCSVYDIFPILITDSVDSKHETATFVFFPD